MKRKWTKEEETDLISMYHMGQMAEMLHHFSRSWVAIKIHAQKLGLSRWKGFQRESDLSVLLSRSSEAMYWLGFLLADGYFSKGGRIKLVLAAKDRDHLKSFSVFIGSELRVDGNRSSVCVAAQDADVVPQLVERFGISNRKTYNPPDISAYELTQEQLFSLIIGFFDGDGHIAKRVYYNSFLGRLKCHASWKANIQFMRDKLCEWLDVKTTQHPFINKQGYTDWFLTAGMLRKMKDQAQHLGLPLLARKWNKVIPALPIVMDSELTSYVCQSTKRTSELARELGIKYTTIYQARRRHN